MSFLPQIKKKKNKKQPHSSSKHHWNQLVILQPKTLPTCRHVLIAFHNELQAHVAKNSELGWIALSLARSQKRKWVHVLWWEWWVFSALAKMFPAPEPGNRSNQCQNGKFIDKPTCYISLYCPDTIKQGERYLQSRELRKPSTFRLPADIWILG